MFSTFQSAQAQPIVLWSIANTDVHVDGIVAARRGKARIHGGSEKLKKVTARIIDVSRAPQDLRQWLLT
jgi:hypothetical protein